MEGKKTMTLQVYKYLAKQFLESDEKEHVFDHLFLYYTGYIHYCIFSFFKKYFAYVSFQFFTQEFDEEGLKLF